MSDGTVIYGTLVRAHGRSLAMHPTHAGVHVFSDEVKAASGAVDSNDGFALDVGETTGLVAVQVDIHGVVPVEVDIESDIAEVHVEIPVNGISAHNA